MKYRRCVSIIAFLAFSLTACSTPEKAPDQEPSAEEATAPCPGNELSDADRTGLHGLCKPDGEPCMENVTRYLIDRGVEPTAERLLDAYREANL